MPITPLHLGVVPLLNRITRRKLNVGVFLTANVVCDLPVVLGIYAHEIVEMGAPTESYPLASHGLHEVFSHTFLGALLIGLVLGAASRFFNRSWMWECLLGTMTHVGLDMFVHQDVHPFAPFTDINPFYFDGAHTILTALLVWGLVVLVLGYWDRKRASHLKPQTSQQDDRP